ncbi:hypothetical protein DBR32_09345 [Taibaiella sp. KBW10]|uniref:hypothetical protein n=1 Tax=Taibaiella sp. KBW10 TaxID=2153357 RepID=UPI000F5B666F|nr:hypothetical protein [Taibaiella sp. KBW10]RQO30906.1 hypothetical protein DBR32_09345 [Taibaiella sp. KBW10]
MKKIIGIAFLGSLCCSCTSEVEKSTGKRTTYYSKDIGWTIKIPEGWQVTDKEMVETLQSKGEAALTETLGESVDFSALKHLANFQKDQFNMFQSSIEPYDTLKEGNWTEHNLFLKKLVYDTYTEKGIKVDSTATTTMQVDGLAFEQYSFTVYAPDGKVLLRQIIYSRYIKGYDFGVNVNYTNEEDKAIMQQAWEQSTFTK